MKNKVLSQEELAKLAAIVQPAATEPTATDSGEVTPPVVDEVVPAAAEFEAKIVEKDKQLEVMAAELEEAKAAAATAITEAQTKFTALETQVNALKGIVAGQVKSMRLALSLSEVDIAALDCDAVIKEYNSTSEMFMKSLPVGSVVPKEESNQAVKAIQSSHDASNIKSLGWV